MPGMLIASGMIWWSKSMKVMTISAARNAKISSPSAVEAEAPDAPTAAMPPSISTSG